MQNIWKQMVENYKLMNTIQLQSLIQKLLVIYIMHYEVVSGNHTSTTVIESTEL